MKKYLSILFAAVLALATACEEGPNGYVVDTSSVVLEAYGPNPVIRGADLTFVGQNLNRVKAVILTPDIAISDFKVFTREQIIITVPQEAQPGVVKLLYGDNDTITSVTSLSFTETVTVTGIAPTDKALVAGDTATVSGDYLYNVVAVGFENNVKVPVEEFGTIDRYSLTFAIPNGAISGKIFVEDQFGNQIYSEGALTITQPTVDEVSPTNVRPGDIVTISGTLLEQIVSIEFAGAQAIVDSLFESASNDAVRVEVPATATDGALTLTTAAGDRLTTTNAVTIKVPTGLQVAAVDVFKAGHKVIITGTDVDLTTGVSFGSEVAEFTVANNAVEATIPATATDGSITLSTAAGKSATTPAITLVKPVITSLSASEVYAGDKFTINGTDLDLIAEVKLGYEALSFEIKSSTAIEATTTLTSQTGIVTVAAANGDYAATSNDLTILYHTKTTVTSITPSASSGDEVTIEGSNFNLIESIYLGETKVLSYKERSDSRIVFVVPEGVESGVYNPRFVLTDGSEENCPLSIEIKGAFSIMEIWEGSHDIGNSWGNALNLAWQGLFNNIPDNSTLVIEFNPAVSGAQAQIMDGNWQILESFPGNEWNVVDIPAGNTSYTCVLTANDISNLRSTGLVLSGQNLVYTKVYITY